MTGGETLEVPVAPSIPGLSFRRFRGEADYPMMASLLNTCAQADGLDYAESVENLRYVFSHLTNCDPYQDMLFVETSATGLHQPKSIAYTRAWWKEEAAGERIYLCHGFVHPAWRRKGLGMALLRYNEGRLRQIAREHPPGPKLFQVWAADGEAGSHVLYTANGYQPIRYMIEMIRPIDAPLHPAPLPTGLAVRTVQPDHIRAIWGAREEAWRDHWGYAPFDEADYRRWLESPLFNPALWQVAWEEDEVAGMVLNRINQAENEKNHRRRGYTQDIFVRRPWRRRGLARALLTRSIQMFVELGMEETALGVDTQNPNGALALYESVGYREIRRHTIYRKPLVENPV